MSGGEGVGSGLGGACMVDRVLMPMGLEDAMATRSPLSLSGGVRDPAISWLPASGTRTTFCKVDRLIFYLLNNAPRQILFWNQMYG